MDTKKNPKKRVVVHSTTFAERWFEKYLELRNTSDDQLYLDVLKELYDERVDDVQVLHLLALIEQRFTFLGDTDRIEQVIGSLINIYYDCNKRLEVKRKYLYTITTLFVCDIDMIEKEPTLHDLLDSFIKNLLKCLKSSSKPLVETAVDCLQQIGAVKPESFKNCDDFETLKNSNYLLAAQLLSNGVQFSKAEFEAFVESLSDVKNLTLFHHCLMYLLKALKTTESQHLLSPLIFKPYISELTLTNEVCNFHLALHLFCSYGLELFSSREEQELIDQLRKMATSVSHPISQRLLALDFWKSLLPVIKLTKSGLVVEIQIGLNDGPDTLEKKLSILTESSLSDDEVMLKLKPIEDLSITGKNSRATNAFYRILYQFYTSRPSMQPHVERLLISMILASPQEHIRRCIDFLEKKPDLVNGVCLQVVQKFLSMDDFVTAEKDLFEYFLFLEWTLKRIFFEEDLLVDIFSCLHKRCQEVPSLAVSLLQCCAAVVRTHVVTSKAKTVLSDILQYLMGNWNDISILSWSQIYLIALNTLTSESDLKSVFEADEILHSSTESPLVEYCGNDCPIIVEQVACAVDAVGPTVPFNMKFKLRLSIDPSADKKFHILYAVTVNVRCSSQGIDVEHTVPVLNIEKPQTVKLYMLCKDVLPFWLSVRLVFGDASGITYVNENSLNRYFSFQDKLLSTTETDFGKLWTQLKSKNAAESFIALHDLHTIDEFYLKFAWLCSFIVKNETNICCLASTDKMLLMRVKLTNNIVNLKILCNDYKMLELIYHEFFPKEC